MLGACKMDHACYCWLGLILFHACFAKEARRERVACAIHFASTQHFSQSYYNSGWNVSVAAVPGVAAAGASRRTPRCRRRPNRRLRRRRLGVRRGGRRRLRGSGAWAPRWGRCSPGPGSAGCASARASGPATTMWTRPGRGREITVKIG